MGESLNCLEKIKKKIIERTRFHSVEDSRWSHTLVQQHIPNKSEFKFIQLDIKEFYPSVTKETLSNIITLEENYFSISNKDIQITKHCMKSLLLYENEAWKKKKYWYRIWCYNGGLWWCGTRRAYWDLHIISLNKYTFKG